MLGKDAAGLCSRQLQLLSPWARRDLFHGIEKGGLTGGVVSLLLVLGVWLTLKESGLAAVVFVAGGCAAGAVLGGIAGWSRENVRIRRFHDDIEAGKILLIVDVLKQNEAPVRRLLAHLPIQPAGEVRSLVPVII